MRGSLQPESAERSRFPAALAAAAAFAGLILFFFYLFAAGPRSRSGAVRLPFGPAEQAYAASIELGNLAMSRAENFVGQEVTVLSGEVHNAGSRPLGQIELTVEFRDSFNQVVLRETRTLLPPAAGPLRPEQRRSFELSFEHIPRDWNFRPPVLRVSGLKFS